MQDLGIGIGHAATGDTLIDRLRDHHRANPRGAQMANGARSTRESR